MLPIWLFRPESTNCGRCGLMLYRGMPEFLYSAWFVDEAALPDDQDREWVACILIDADCAETARSWGDSLAQDRATLSPSDCFVRSSIEDKAYLDEAADWSSVPRVEAGRPVSGEKMGW